MATLTELLGDAYREGMTLEEVEAALANCDILTRTAAENLAAQRTAATQRLLNTANKKLSDAQKEKTTADNSLADALARIGVLEENEKVSQRTASIATTKASLIAQGYSEALASETAEAMVDNDMAKVLANQGKFLAEKTQAIRDELLQGTKPPAGGGSGTGGIDYKAAKEAALQAGNDLEYLRLSRLEAEQTSEK